MVSPRARFDATAASQGAELIKLWRENYRFTAEQLSKALQRFLLLALGFTLLSTARLSEVSVFGLKFQGLDAPLALSYLVSGFLFYRVLSLFSLSQLLESVLSYSYERTHPAWHAEGLTALTQYPGVSNLESTLSSLEKGPTWFLRISDLWGYGAPISVVMVSLGWFIWAGTVVVRELPIGWAAIILALAGLCVVRGILIVIHVLYRV